MAFAIDKGRKSVAATYATTYVELRIGSGQGSMRYTQLSVSEARRTAYAILAAAEVVAEKQAANAKS